MLLQLNDICVKNILKNLTLNVKKGEFVLIVGANGAGKTTLFNTISGASSPNNGSVFINGRDITLLDRHKRSAQISSVLQDPRAGTIAEMTIFENLKLAYLRNRCIKKYRKIVEYFKEKLSLIGLNLENRMNEYVRNLSGGQRQALSLVMATVGDYELLLLDEITAALDTRTSDMVMEITSKIVANEKKTCLAITHDQSHMNLFGDRTLKMENGQLSGFDKRSEPC
ncbi:ABC transporter ATP-binding protein [Alphaproteobacteria bacterium]|nr:ABC transporter ATP-binding protein [Alphaproteobacteria bacterium]